MKQFKKFIELSESKKFRWTLEKNNGNNEPYYFRLWRDSWNCHLEPHGNLEDASAEGIQIINEYLEYKRKINE
jgi:hypothetical protein|tara:strand:- start:13210 stop:13428 length:219 start_codon:yes stop_codon:yes gene_type:complete